MAGSLVISANRFWGPPTWIFVGVLRSALEHLSVANAPQVAERLKAGISEDEGFFVDLDGLPQAELQALRRGLERGYQTTEDRGAGAFQTPEFYPSFMEEYRRLVEQLRLALAEANEKGTIGRNRDMG